MRYETLIEPAQLEPSTLIGVPTYRGLQRCAWLLESLSTRLPPSAQLVLLDDGTPDGIDGGGYIAALTELVRQHPGVGLLRHPRNCGITASWNDLARCRPSEIVVWLNDDIVITESGTTWLDNMLYFLRETPGAGSACWNTYFCKASDVPALLRGEDVVPRDPMKKTPKPELRRTNPDELPGVLMCPLGAAFACTRANFDRVGGFDEAMVQTHNESQLGTDLAALGLPSFAIPWPPVWHIWSATFQANGDLLRSGGGDRDAYTRKYGGHFAVTHPRYMSKIPPVLTRWVDMNGRPRAEVREIQ